MLEKTSAELGPRCTWVGGDIRVAADCEQIVDAALERHGHVDTLLNNAGGQYFAPPRRSRRRAGRRCCALNVDGTLQMTRACVSGRCAQAGEA